MSISRISSLRNQSHTKYEERISVKIMKYRKKNEQLQFQDENSHHYSKVANLKMELQVFNCWYASPKLWELNNEVINLRKLNNENA